MNLFLHGLVRAICETFDLPGPIVEIGSYQVPGQEEIIDLRGLFVGREYIGVDMRPGPGVDCVADVEDLPYADGSLGTVVALNTFEHVQRFWRGFDEIRRVLRPDGALLVACPFNFHIHNYPNDYWRFTPAALEYLLEDYPCKILGWNGTDKRPIGVWALAVREEHPAVSADEFCRFKNRLEAYGPQPMTLRKRVRYRLGSWLFGRRAFSTVLDRDRWHAELHHSPLTTHHSPLTATDSNRPSFQDRSSARASRHPSPESIPSLS